MYIGPTLVGKVETVFPGNRYEFLKTGSSNFVEVKGGSQGINLAEIEVFGTLGINFDYPDTLYAM